MRKINMSNLKELTVGDLRTKIDKDKLYDDDGYVIEKQENNHNTVDMEELKKLSKINDSNYELEKFSESVLHVEQKKVGQYELLLSLTELLMIDIKEEIDICKASNLPVPKSVYEKAKRLADILSPRQLGGNKKNG
jgi:hypothetical protein